MADPASSTLLGQYPPDLLSTTLLLEDAMQLLRDTADLTQGVRLHYVAAGEGSI